MVSDTRAPGAEPERLTAERFLSLVREGVLSERDRVELLNGVVVAMAPSNPRHAAAVAKAAEVLQSSLRGRAAVRCQLALVLGERSVPEPDVAVVPGQNDHYVRSHPRTALLVVEVSDWSLGQDRITKAAVYATAGIPEYWIVNLRDDRVEVRRDPDATRGLYRSECFFQRGESIELAAFPGASVAVEALLPGSETEPSSGSM